MKKIIKTMVVACIVIGTAGVSYGEGMAPGSGASHGDSLGWVGEGMKGGGEFLSCSHGEGLKAGGEFQEASHGDALGWVGEGMKTGGEFLGSSHGNALGYYGEGMNAGSPSRLAAPVHEDELPAGGWEMFDVPMPGQ